MSIMGPIPVFFFFFKAIKKMNLYIAPQGTIFSLIPNFVNLFLTSQFFTCCTILKNKYCQVTTVDNQLQISKKAIEFDAEPTNVLNEKTHGGKLRVQFKVLE